MSTLFPDAVLLSIPKTGNAWTGWLKRTNHAGHLIGTAELFDHLGVSIPGKTLQIEVKSSIVVPACLYLFSVMSLEGRDRRMVYRLEVCPTQKRSHNGPLPIYGPHEHEAGCEALAVADASVNCDSWDNCVAWFLARTKISCADITNPFNP